MMQLIVECVVRSVVIAFCTAIVLYVLRVKAARVRHAVWASVVVLMLVLPVWTAWGPKAVLRILKPAPAIAVAQPAVAQQTLPEGEGPASPVERAVWTWQDSLLGLYLLGFAVLAVRLLTGTVRTWMLIRRAEERTGRLTSESCVTPITVGWFAPSVILPPSWTGWSRAQLDAVLAHEDEHARRRDPLVQWLALLNRAVFWFHPLAWWLSRQLSALAEEACDDAVLLRGHDPLCYSEYLLGLARVVQESGARVGVVGMAMPGTFLPQRIRRIAAGVAVQRVSRLRIACVGMLCALVSTVFTVGAVGYSRAEAEISAPAEFAVPLLQSRGPEGLSRTTDELLRTVDGALRKRNVLLAQAKAPAAPPVASAVSSAATGQSISGVVIDPSGAVVADAPVTLTDTDTGATASTTSDNTGRYWFRNIDVGTYSVMLNVRGFKRLTQTGIAVAAGDAHNTGTMFLALGTVAESLSVVGSRSAVAATTLPNDALPLRVANSNYTAVIGRRAIRMASAGPARIGGDVQAALLVNQIKPDYPTNLQQQGVAGTVKINAVISKEGMLTGLQVVSSPDPGLTQAALDAVSQWRYQPTMLNDQPVETVTTVDVNFSLTK